MVVNHTHCFRCGAPIPFFAPTCWNCHMHFIYFCPICGMAIAPGVTACSQGHTFASACPSPAKAKPIGGICRFGRPLWPLNRTIRELRRRLEGLTDEDTFGQITNMTQQLLSEKTLTVKMLQEFLRKVSKLLHKSHIERGRLDTMDGLIDKELTICPQWAMHDIVDVLTVDEPELSDYA
jgi:predicted nucleic acid-binding Zn ribbon protein